MSTFVPYNLYRSASFIPSLCLQLRNNYTFVYCVLWYECKHITNFWQNPVINLKWGYTSTTWKNIASPIHLHWQFRDSSKSNHKMEPVQFGFSLLFSATDGKHVTAHCQDFKMKGFIKENI